MKNAIKYYYNLELTSIRQFSKVFTFESNNESYILINYDNPEINEIYNLSNYLLNINIITHQIILNNNSQLLTVINNDSYVLLKSNSNNEVFSLEELLAFSNVYIENSKLKKTNWFELWTKKIDYFEYQISQIGKKYKLITESFSYYIGLAENAINLFQNIKKENLYISLSHRRINFNDTNFNLYNPLNLIVDYRLRDMCEYLKSCFFNHQNVKDNILLYLKILNEEEQQLFFARMLFPTYYFDCYEKIISNQISEEELIKIVSMAEQYENLLREVYLYISGIPEIDWLKKVIQY